MRNQTLCSLFCIAISLLSCMEQNRRMAAIEQAVRAELQRYPEATLLDLYKFFFQGAFGPGHMIPNAEAARQYLEEELRTSTSFDTVRWQPVGYEGKFYRINLRLAHEGAIEPQKLLEVFVASANEAAPPSLEDWRKEWEEILKVIAGMSLTLANFEEDKSTIAQRFAEGKASGHHSETFERLYHPHYRVVDKKHFETLIR